MERKVNLTDVKLYDDKFAAMERRKQIDKWEAAGVLWVCQTCDAHLRADSVGETCPKCGSPAGDDE